MQVLCSLAVAAMYLSTIGLSSAATSRAAKVIKPAMSFVVVSAGLRAVRAAGVAAGVGAVRDRLRAGLQDRRNAMRMGRKEVCYDMVGCFSALNNPLKRLPQSPDSVDTKFWLMTRSNQTHTPQRIRYGDNLRSLSQSDFDPTKTTRVLIHGFKGSAHDDGALAGAAAFLKMEDVNMVMVDWEKGASSPYTTAAANTELIGRQVGLVLLDMMSLGAHPDAIHIIGFSLGAHVAGCAGQVVKNRGRMVGRISGLDPASPLFRRQLLREAAQKLDAGDARFVDVIHTDGGALWTDGFGLLGPLGHVDYFPNGGRQQPGCTDPRASVVVSHFEGVVNSSTVCSHARAWSLFLETIATPEPGRCQFQAFPCPQGGTAFQQGHCFPARKICDPAAPGPSCGVMGMRAEETPARGPLYLVTRDSPPYCGDQIQASVVVSKQTAPTRGVLQLQLLHGSSNTSFQMACEFMDGVQQSGELRALAAAQWGSLGPDITPRLTARISYQSLAFQSEPPSSATAPTPTVPTTTASPAPSLYLDRVTVRDLRGNSWQYCGANTALAHAEGTLFDQLTVELGTEPC
ncbi:pancreatic triacylglycerol lipase-like [Thrips palmi]|uniref:Pancreatic triacylglycerol lipase-like n=1 Tax=Thrips palmi TaxID=161013 RepID=A0A6P8Z4J7_THRPL|nr:pancreatic triacylglycerol lipase-like [Thrips palmi]